VKADGSRHPTQPDEGTGGLRQRDVAAVHCEEEDSRDANEEQRGGQLGEPDNPRSGWKEQADTGPVPERGEDVFRCGVPGELEPQGIDEDGGDGVIREVADNRKVSHPKAPLRDLDGKSVLPIWVGAYEANAIALEIEKVTTPRPMTHDLIKNLLMGADLQMRKVVVSELKEDTFYAVIWLEREGEIVSIDSRPSDALALALRMDCPIFVDDDVLRSSKVSQAVSDKATSDELRRWLENLSDEDLGQYKM